MKLPITLLLAGLAGLSQAQTMKPGLWEMKSSTQLDPEQQAKVAQMQKAMENMPPERRKMMEDVMAKQGGGMSLAGGTMTQKACITKEQAERDLAPTDFRGNCTHDAKRSGNTIQTHFVCTNPASEGDVTTTLRGSEGFRNDVTVRHERKGKMETMKLSSEGRWLGADCGDIQPFKARAKP